MHLETGNIEIMINDKADEVIKEILHLLRNRYQNDLKSVKGNEIVFDYVQLLYYKRQNINPNCGGSYMDSPEWVKNKNK